MSFIVTPAGQFIPMNRGRFSPMQLLVARAVNEGIVEKGGQTWPALRALAKRDVTAASKVRAYVNTQLVWNASAPHFTVDGRRIS